MPRQSRAPDWEIGFPPELGRMFANWGSGSFITKFSAPSLLHNPELVGSPRDFERQSCIPTTSHLRHDTAELAADNLNAIRVDRCCPATDPPVSVAMLATTPTTSPARA